MILKEISLRRWVKILFLENKLVLNFDFRHGAKKSGNQ